MSYVQLIHATHSFLVFQYTYVSPIKPLNNELIEAKINKITNSSNSNEYLYSSYIYNKKPPLGKEKVFTN